MTHKNKQGADLSSMCSGITDLYCATSLVLVIVLDQNFEAISRVKGPHAHDTRIPLAKLNFESNINLMQEVVPHSHM
jgi:hypothetical protein